jgi:transposase
MKELVTLSARELQRSQVLERVGQGRLTLVSGTRLLQVSYRQAKRLLARFRREGPAGMAHKRRAQPARNALGSEMRDRILSLHEERYANFNDTHFTEMLAEREGLKVGRETVRRWLRQAGIKPKRRRRPPQHRSRRPRRPQMGLLMQWDGSPHRWFGPPRPPCSLLHATDDATNTVLGALFRPTEDAIGYLRLLDAVLRTHGVPAAVYQDRHSALFRNDTKWTLEEELAGIRFLTHVGWVLDKLHVVAIPAFSAQAKGRIERQGGTFQDRLIAEMALEGITEMDKANAWLERSFLPRYNARFAKSPEKPGSAFRKISAAERYLTVCFAYKATVANDNTICLRGLVINIPPGPRQRSYARRRVEVRQHLDGAWTVWLEDHLIAKHPATPLREPLRMWRPREKGESQHVNHLVQLYLETTPAPSEGTLLLSS